MQLKDVIKNSAKGELPVKDIPSGLAARELQTYLKKAGYDVGAIDGIVGPKTVAQFAAFKKASWLAKPELIGLGSMQALVTEALERSEQPAKPEVAPAAEKYRGGKMISIFGQGYYLEAPVLQGGHLSWSEMTHNGTRIPPNRAVFDNFIRIAKGFEEVRKILGGVPITVTSGYRPPAVNRRVGGATFSRHLRGDALDLYVPGYTGRGIKAKINSRWNGGLGVYRSLPNIIHIDKGPNRRWG